MLMHGLHDELQNGGAQPLFIDAVHADIRRGHGPQAMTAAAQIEVTHYVLIRHRQAAVAVFGMRPDRQAFGVFEIKVPAHDGLAIGRQGIEGGAAAVGHGVGKKSSSVHPLLEKARHAEHGGFPCRKHSRQVIIGKILHHADILVDRPQRAQGFLPGSDGFRSFWIHGFLSSHRSASAARIKYSSCSGVRRTRTALIWFMMTPLSIFWFLYSRHAPWGRRRSSVGEMCFSSSRSR